jgi:hypothetical protein
MNRSLLNSLLVPLVSLFMASEMPAQDLLPDIIVRDTDLYDYDVVTDGDRVLLRFATGTPNIGEGPLHVVGVFPANPDGSQDVDQRIFQEGGGFRDRSAGQFDFHSGHEHVHLEGWAIYKLRERLPDGSAGDVIAESQKTSFCLVDLGKYEVDLLGAPSEPVYRSCGETFQGISVGWVDIYGKQLIGQNIDIKGLPYGEYWLEVTADPDDKILELDEGNNVTSILVEIGDPTLIDGPLEEVPTDLHGDDHDRPDLRIGTSPNPDSHMGNDVYEPAPEGSGHDHNAHDHGALKQVIRLSSRRARKLKFYASLQNESADQNTYIVQCTGGRPRKLKIKHFDTTGPSSRNISAKVSTAGVLANMESDEMKTYCSKASLTQKSRDRRKSGKKIRCKLGFKAWSAAAKDVAWIYLKFP